MNTLNTKKHPLVKSLLAAQVAACMFAGASAFADSQKGGMSEAREMSNDQASARTAAKSQDPQAVEFSYMDTNNDQQVDWDELSSIYQDRLQQVNWDKEDALERFDKNDDDSFNKAEYVNLRDQLAQSFTSPLDQAQASTSQAMSGQSSQTGKATDSSGQQADQQNTMEAANTQISSESRQASTDSATTSMNTESSEPNDYAPDSVIDSSVNDDISNAESAQVVTATPDQTVQTRLDATDPNVSSPSRSESSSSEAQAVTSPKTGNTTDEARNISSPTMQTTAGTQSRSTMQAGEKSQTSANRQASTSAQQERNSASQDSANPQAATSQSDAGENALQEGTPAVITTTIVAVFPEHEMSVDEIEDKEVVNNRGETVGEVEDVIISSDGVVKGLVVEVGGFLDIGDKDVFVDIADVTVSETGVLWKTSMDTDDLKALPEYDSDLVSAL